MPPLQRVRVLDQLRERIRYLHCSLLTEEAHVYWAKAFIRFHDLRHPAEMGKAEIEAYLMWLETIVRPREVKCLPVTLLSD